PLQILRMQSSHLRRFALRRLDDACRFLGFDATRLVPTQSDCRRKLIDCRVYRSRNIPLPIREPFTSLDNVTNLRPGAELGLLGDLVPEVLRHVPALFELLYISNRVINHYGSRCMGWWT